MEVLYKSKTLQNFLENGERLVGQFGLNAFRIMQRLSELESSDTLDDFNSLPMSKCSISERAQELKFMILISENLRLIFETQKESLKKNAEGDIDWSRITSIRILGIRES
ncbi:MAG: hypothetical protein ACEPOW_02720 [Bacteroidales bacterium]